MVTEKLRGANQREDRFSIGVRRRRGQPTFRSRDRRLHERNQRVPSVADPLEIRFKRAFTTSARSAGSPTSGLNISMCASASNATLPSSIVVSVG